MSDSTVDYFSESAEAVDAAFGWGLTAAVAHGEIPGEVNFDADGRVVGVTVAQRPLGRLQLR